MHDISWTYSWANGKIYSACLTPDETHAMCLGFGHREDTLLLSIHRVSDTPRKPNPLTGQQQCSY